MNEKNEEDCATLSTIITHMVGEKVSAHGEYHSQEIKTKEGMI